MLPGGHVICYRNDRITYSQELIEFLFFISYFVQNGTGIAATRLSHI